VELESTPGGSQTPALPHELRSHLVDCAALESACLALQASALPSELTVRNSDYSPKLVEDRRIELRLNGCRPLVLPLSLIPRLVAGAGVEPAYEAYETSD
jgi:hypothetical protein